MPKPPAHDSLATAVSVRAFGAASDTLECLAVLAVGAGSHREAARLFGAADVYAKLGLTSRVQLAQEVARHG